MVAVDELLQQGIAAYKAGRKAEARDLFVQALKLDENDEKVWLWLSGAVETAAERRACLERVLAINPANRVARQGLEHLGAPGSQPAASRQPPHAPSVETPPRAAPDIPQVSSEPSPARVEALAKQEGDGVPLILWLMVAGLGLIFICVMVLLANQLLGDGFQLSGASPTEPPSAITSVVYENIAAHNAEDIDRYVATMHSGSPGYRDLRSTLAQVYASYDLDHDVSGVELLEVSRNEARVSFVLVTRKLRGPDFRDNRIEGVFILRKEGGDWKLYNQEIDEIEYLE